MEEGAETADDLGSNPVSTAEWDPGDASARCHKFRLKLFGNHEWKYRIFFPMAHQNGHSHEITKARTQFTRTDEGS